MASTLPNRCPDPPRKAIAARLRVGAKVDCKPLAVEWKHRMGAVVARALVLANMTKQEASFEMGYPDASAISRWVAGIEPTQWHRLMAIDQLRPWIPVALAEQAGAEVQTTVTVRRRA